jgi:RuvB-like protein 1 (pontin 52)
VQLLSPARLLAQVDARDTVSVQDIDECRTMFMDAKMSARVCLQQEKPDEKMDLNASA